MKTYRPVPLSVYLDIKLKVYRHVIPVVVAVIVSLLFGAITLALKVRGDLTLLKAIAIHTSSLVEIEDRPELLRLVKSIASNTGNQVRVIRNTEDGKNGIVDASSSSLSEIDRPFSMSQGFEIFSGVQLSAKGLMTSIPINRPGGAEDLRALIAIQTPLYDVLITAVIVSWISLIGTYVLMGLYASKMRQTIHFALSPFREIDESIRALKDSESEIRLDSIQSSVVQNSIEGSVQDSVGIEELENIRASISETHSHLIHAQKLLLESERSKALSEIATQVAHDIRSPLAAMEVVITGLGGVSEDKRLIVRSAVGRMRDIANNLLEKSRSESDSHRDGEEKESIHLLTGLVDSLISEKRMQHRSKLGVEIAFDFNAESYGLFAKVQPVEFKRMLSNLVNNAVEAIADRGKVSVHLKGSAESIEIHVQDDGRGIPAEIIPTLTKRGETHGKADGNGLGLYHAKTTVEALGGKMSIQSEIGRGTTVLISLPRATPPEWFLKKISVREGDRIVILDDDESIHQIWRGRFETPVFLNLNVKLSHFSSSQELIQWHRQGYGTMASTNSTRTLYLMDYELLGDSRTGLDVIEELGICSESILITSRHEEISIRDRCSRLRIPLIPKGMAGFVPVEMISHQSRYDAVLVDDDSLVRVLWHRTAEGLGKRLLTFSSVAEFFESSVSGFGLDRTTPIYLDSHLGDGESGEHLAEKLYSLGFSRLYLATGYEPSRFAHMSWLHGVVGKEPPWVGS